MAEPKLSNLDLKELLQRERDGTLSRAAQDAIAERRKAGAFPPPLSQLGERSKRILEGQEPVEVRERGIGRTLGEAAAPFAGGTLGAIAGGALGGPGGAMAGAALGGAAGEAVNPYVFRAMGLDEPASLTGNRLVDIGVSGIASGAAEVGTQGLRAAGSALGSSLGVTPVPNAPRTLRAMTDLGVTPKVTDVSGSRLPSIIERGLMQTPVGQGQVSVATEAQARQMNAAANTFLNTIGAKMSATQVGTRAKERVQEAVKQFRSVEDDLYDQVGRVANPIPIDIRKLKQFAGDLVAQESKLLPGDRNQALLDDAKAIFKAPDEVPFELVQQWRKGIGRSIDPKRFIATLPEGESKGLFEALSGAMEDGIAQSANPAAQRLWELARAFSTKGRALFKDSSLANIAKMDPEDAMRAVDLAGGPSAIKRAREAILGDPALNFAANPTTTDLETWNALRRNVLEGVFSPAKQEVRGGIEPVLVGSRLEKNLNELGDESLTELLSPTERGALDKLVMVAKAIRSSERVAAQGYTSTTPQGLMVKGALSAPGAAIGMVVGGPQGAMVGGFLSYVLTAPVLAKAVTSERVARIIASPAFDTVVKAVQTGGKITGEVAQVLGQLGAALAVEGHRPGQQLDVGTTAEPPVVERNREMLLR